MRELLDAIVANPEDDAVRRVYADALLQSGEPQGELIHVQLDLLGERTCERGRELRAYERELLAAHEKRWTAPLRERGVSAVRFRRGFVEHVVVDAESFARCGLELFEHAPLLRDVVLAGLVDPSADDGDAMIARFEAVLASPAIERVEGLRYDIGYFTPEPWGSGWYETLAYEAWPLLRAAGPRLRRLRALALPEASDRELAEWPRLAQLDRLDLTGFSSAARHVVEAIRPGQLRALVLPRVHREYYVDYLALPGIAGVTALGCGWSYTAGEGESALLQRPVLASVRRFACDALASDVLVRALAASEALANVVELDMDGTSFSALKELADPPRLDALRALYVRTTLMSEAEAQSIHTWPIARRLEVLEISREVSLYSKAGHRLVL